MSTEEWLQRVLEIITDSDAEDTVALLLKFARIAADLGYELSFDGE